MKSQRRIGFAAGSYPIDQFAAVMHDALPVRLPVRCVGLKDRWTPRKLALGAVLMNWSGGEALKDRFAWVLAQLAAMFPGQRRAGATYPGFIAALLSRGAAVLALLLAGWRSAVVHADGLVCGYALFGVDGTRVDTPRTDANIEAFGCAGKPGTTPQMLLTMLVHLHSWLPWSWRRGPGTASERGHAKEMLADLPDNAMLLADALYTSYDLLRQIDGSGRAFLVRAGRNVTLIRNLGVIARELEGTVYLWPKSQRIKNHPPLILRLVRVKDHRNKTWSLLTNVTDPARLSDADIAQLYRRRWGVEVLHRTLKQTLGRGVLASRCPGHAEVELDWSVAGLAALALIALRTGVDPARRAVAKLVRVLHRWTHRPPRLNHAGQLRGQLAAATQDRHTRKAGKTKRRWCRKYPHAPPGNPIARAADAEELQAAKQFVRPAA